MPPVRDLDEANQIDFYGTGDGPDFSRVFINTGQTARALR
jgi:hypothetical protein